ncbi:IclR family transcriptional regulator [Virgibacillus xinjiangensis]|uniref:IclR family transcriptional regulator n=1 Tax=Virgibacillus xinjiangensis TaxID=393090 RepID=A0ABV7CZI2_9BACI
MSQSLLKAVKLLECFKGIRELSLMELVDQSRLPKTTVFRLVSSLEEAGLLVKEKRSSHEVRYRLGLKLLELGNLVVEQLDYRNIAIPHMSELNRELNELVFLTVMEGEEAVYVEKMDSSKPVRLIIKTGRRSPLYAGSAPKLLLAHMNPFWRQQYIEKIEIRKLNENTIGSKELLQEELRGIRESGYSISRSEHFKDTMGFSCPIRDYQGDVIAAVGVSIPVTEYSPDRETFILEKAKQTAEGISRDLGYTGSMVPE